MTQKTLKEILKENEKEQAFVFLYNNDGETIDRFLAKDWNKETKRQIGDFTFEKIDNLVKNVTFGLAGNGEIIDIEINLNW